MGALNSKTEQDLKIYLKTDYDITHYPTITHRISKKQAIVHQITTDSTQQANKIRSDVNLYQHLNCPSISNIIQYIPLQTSKICSDQQYHYIIEEDMQKYNLKQQFLARKYFKQKFSDHQIITIIKTYLSGLNVYHSKFHRNFYDSLKLQSMTIDQKHNNQLRLTDPLLLSDSSLVQKVDLSSQSQMSQRQTKISYLNKDQKGIKQAPQKLDIRKTKFNENKIQLNELLTDIYKVGIIGLQLHRMKLFDGSQKYEILPQQIQQISNKQIKKIIRIMTDKNAQERGRVYEVLKISVQEQFNLQRNYRNYQKTKDNQNHNSLNHQQFSNLINQNNIVNFNKNVSNNQYQHNFNSYSSNRVQLIPPIKKQESFSFGLSQPQIPNITYASKTSHYSGNYSSQSKINLLPLSLDKPQQQTKKQTASNMSTDRTIHQYNHQNLVTSHHSSKPIIKFNNSTNHTANNSSHHLSTPNYNPSVFTNSLPNLQTNERSHNLLPSSKSSFITKDSLPKSLAHQTPAQIHQHPLILINKQSNTNNINFGNTLNASNFINNSSLKTNHYVNKNNSLVSNTEYPPLIKQQENSPLIKNDNSLAQSSYKQIFDKYAHLNYKQSNLSPNKIIQNRRMEEQMNRLLKQQSNKNSSPIKLKSLNNQFQDISPIKKQSNAIDSLINISQQNKLYSLQQNKQHNKNFSLQQNKKPIIHNQQNQFKSKNLEQNSSIPTYRPNKQVEQILKRLGIGSLLYGNAQTNKNQQQIISNLNQYNAKTNHQANHTQQQQNIFIHKGAYNINSNSFAEKNHTKIENKKQKFNEQIQDDIHDRQTTPIRPVQKNKYNSTIVEVGDQDSQYSSSSIKNGDQNIDLSKHEYVVQQYQTGSRYEGYKLYGERDGHGKFFYQDGGFYEGQWKNNKMDGWGKLYYEGGKLAYEGNWCQDQFHGFGKVYNDNPLQLECGFDFTNFDLLEDYWEFYEGMLVKDTKQGRGKIKLTNGQIFEGDFHNDRIQGFGKFFMKQGNMVEGIWRDSKLIKIISS